MAIRPPLDDLARQLEEFQLDDPEASLPFSRRLARDNDWSHAFALRVIDEYKRFVYLAMRAGHPVTPSEAVDQAWHLHLCYTRSYWEEMCGDLLGKPLHHGPTRGGPEEREKFHDWYSRTLESYQRIFGETPPADIWPDSEKRFSSCYQWVDRNANLIIPRIPRGLVVAMAVMFAWMFVVVGCRDASPGRFALVIIVFAFLAFAGAVVLGIASKGRGKSRKGGDGCGSGCDGAGCSSGGDGGCGGCGGCGD